MFGKSNIQSYIINVEIFFLKYIRRKKDYVNCQRMFILIYLHRYGLKFFAPKECVICEMYGLFLTCLNRLALCSLTYYTLPEHSAEQ